MGTGLSSVKIRRIFRLAILCGAFSVGLWAVSERAVASILLGVELIADGSAKPPGDQIDCSVLFLAREAPLVLEVRAFTIDNGLASPVKAKTGQNRDPDGRFVLRQTVNSPADKGGEAKTEIVVPYEQLDIAMGNHGFGYEITGTRGGTTLFVTATKQSSVNITPQPRTQMLRRVTVPIVRTRSKAVSLSSKLPSGEIKTETVLHTAPAKAALHQTRAEAVNIANGFFRAVPSPTSPLPGEDPNERFLKELTERAWAPVRGKVIYFATNRTVDHASAGPGKQFGTGVDTEMHYGSCQVNIPSEKVHQPGVLEQAGWWGKNPGKYFSVEVQNAMAEKEFFTAAANALRGQTAGGDVLLFVHGYNNTFEFAVLRAAQVVNDVEFPGFPILFSFPSLGTLTGYKSDEDHAEKSVSSLASVLKGLIDSRPTSSNAPGKIHIVAHSLGNRMLLRAILNLALPPGHKVFGHVVLAAPDVDVPDFLQQTPALIDLSDDVSFYYCEDDVALFASHEIHHDQRAGEGLMAVPQLFNIDAENANTSLLGHDYYASSSRVLTDEDLLINQGIAAGLRPTLQGRNGKNQAGAAYAYWIFP